MGKEVKMTLENDNSELAGYFESFLEDFKEISSDMLAAINTDRGATLKIPDAEYNRLKRIGEALDGLAKRKFNFENTPNFQPVVDALGRVQKSIDGFKFPDKIPFDMPLVERNIATPEIDMKPVSDSISKLEQLFTSGIGVHITNFEDMPLVFDKVTGGSGGGVSSEVIDDAVHAEDSPHTTGDKGMLLLGVRDDGFTTFGANGDYIPIATNYQGAVKVIAGESAGLNIRALTNTDVVTVELSAVDNAVLDTIDAVLDTIKTDTAAIVTSVQTIDNAIAGSEMQVDVLTMPTITVNSHAVTNAGTFAVQVDGAALTALQLIDDIVQVDDAAFTPATSKIAMVGAEFDDTTPDSVDEGDAGALRMSGNRNLYVRIRDNAGNERGLNVDASGQIAVTLAASQTLATLTNITNWGNIVDNAGFTDGTTRLLMNGFIFDETAGTALTENDGAAARVDAKRAQVMVIEDVSTRGTTNRLAITTRLSAYVEGPTAADAAIAANPMTIGGRASDTVPSAMSSGGDVVNAWFGLRGEQITSLEPKAFGGCSVYKTLDLDETEEDVKTTAGSLYGWHIFNAAATTRYIKFYNATAANVTVGTTTPVMTVPIPAGAAANVEFSNGIGFSTAICIAATTGVADNDTGAPAANDVIMNVFYK